MKLMSIYRQILWKSGNLLKYVHSNRLRKDYYFYFEEELESIFIFSISSKINKCYCILMFYQGLQVTNVLKKLQ